MQAQRSAKRAYGSGSIFEVDGTWYGKWRVDGRQVKRRIGPKRTRGEADGITKSQAEARLREFMAEVAADDIRSRSAKVRSRNGYTIQELGDLFIDQQWQMGDAAIQVPDYDVRILPASGLAQLYIHELLAAQLDLP